jgi:hypothetical protein
MQRRQFLSGTLIPALAGVSVCGLTGCGAFVHSERVGQLHSNEIDWKIAALDALGLLLFFIPGVVAFVVDFSTGAIYLPLATYYPAYGAGPPVPLGFAPASAPPPPGINPGHASTAAAGAGQQQRPPASQNLGLKRVVLPREQLEPQGLQQVVSDHVGREISLADDQARLSQMARLDQFDEQLNRHRSNRTFGYPVQSYFSQLTHV